MTRDQSTLDEFALGLSELTAALLSDRDIEQAISDVAGIASRMLPGQPMVGVTLKRDGDATTVASSGAKVLLIEEIQYGNGRGPCLEAIETGQPVSVPDLLEEHRWGRYPALVLAHGVRSIRCHPLVADGTPIGALNLYSAQPDTFDREVVEAAELTASHIGVLLSALISGARRAELTEQLRAGMASRSVIDQALGIVMGQRRCSRAAAFDILRKISQERNVELADLAADTVRTFSEPTQTHIDNPGSRRKSR